MMRALLLLILAGWLSFSTHADTPPGTSVRAETLQQQPTLELATAEEQERCITIMSAFPDTGHQPRYHFFRLVEAINEDASPEFRETLAVYRGDHIPPETPIVDVVEGIANPVLRQAVPNLAVAQTAHLIDFAVTCESFITGQVQSLQAYDPTLTDTDTNRIILEDALFLRQVLADALYRLDANLDPVHGARLAVYSRSLIAARDELEFQSFESEIDEIEALFLADLDGRLARSNDIINGEMTNESIQSAISLNNDLNKSAREQHEQRMRLTLLRLLGAR